MKENNDYNASVSAFLLVHGVKHTSKYSEKGPLTRLIKLILKLKIQHQNWSFFCCLSIQKKNKGIFDMIGKNLVFDNASTTWSD
jgi:hypothetical protein